jgi:hypothetical protein
MERGRYQSAEADLWRCGSCESWTFRQESEVKVIEENLVCEMVCLQGQYNVLSTVGLLVLTSSIGVDS